MARRKPQLPSVEQLTSDALDLALAPMPSQPVAEEDVDAVARRLSAALTSAEPGEMDLAAIADVELSGVDVAYFARLTRVAAYIRLWHFLRRRPRSFEEERDQSAMSLGYLKFSESDSGMKAMLAGRSRGDETLEVTLSQMKMRLKTITQGKIDEGIAQKSKANGG